MKKTRSKVLPGTRGLLVARALLAFCLALGAGKALASWLPLWLDGPPGRVNPNDPKSPYYRTPVPLPTPARTGTATPTPTVSPTPSATPTPTISPTFTITPYVYYDGDTPGRDLDNINRVSYMVTPSTGPSTNSNYDNVAETSGGDALGGNFFARATMQTLWVPIQAGIGNTPTASVDVSAYGSISLWLRSPDGNFEPQVMLVSPGSVSSSTSCAVTATAYTTDGGAFDAGTWKHVVIPLSAFDGVNFWGSPYSLAANGDRVSAVAFSPAWPECFHYDSTYLVWVFLVNGPLQYMGSSLDIDDVTFQAAAGPVPAARVYPPTFDGFHSSDGVTAWETSWTVNSDSYTCVTPATAVDFPAPGGAPVDFASSPQSNDMVGHLSGTAGAADGVAPCPASQFSFVNMSANFSPSGSPVSLASLPGLPSPVHGLSWTMKMGPNSDPIDYDVVLTKASVNALNPGASYYHLCSDAQLDGQGWVTYKVDFPASGFPSTDFLNGWGQPSWAAGSGDAVDWDTSDLVSVQVKPDDAARGRNFDVFVDHFQFY